MEFGIPLGQQNMGKATRRGTQGYLKDHIAIASPQRKRQHLKQTLLRKITAQLGAQALCLHVHGTRKALDLHVLGNAGPARIIASSTNPGPSNHPAAVPKLFRPRDWFCGRQYFHRPGSGYGFGMIHAHYIYHTLYF